MTSGTIHVVELWPDVDTCCICGCDVVISRYFMNYGIPMYEDKPVPPEWTGEWGGFAACKPCYDRYENAELPMWTVPQLQWATRPMPGVGHE